MTTKVESDLDTQQLSQAFIVIEKAMKDDPAYAYGWHANIAMAMFDAMPETFWMPDKKEYHKIANQAATTFMKRAFHIDTSQDMLLENTDD